MQRFSFILVSGLNSVVGAKASLTHLANRLPLVLSLALAFNVCGVAWLYTAQAAHAQAADPAAKVLSKAELEKLAKPIALYPDLLLQQVLAASTFPEQILDAAMYNEQGKEPKDIPNQPWDDSVKGVANYPSIIVKMATDLDWTIALGSAFINQNEALRNAIQGLRAKAKSVGNLEDSEYQEVIEEKGGNNTTIIRIEPAQPQVIYVPAPSTTTVYEKPVQSSSSWMVPLASFGVGMALGYAMGDNHDDHYYYAGGFYGPGFWYGGPAVNNWVDYRRDRWDDAYDFARDRQDWQQNNRDDWREYRQDLGRKQQEWRNERSSNGTALTPEKRAEARSRAQSAQSSWQGKSPEQRRAALESGSLANRAQSSSFDRAAASERLKQARNNEDLKSRAQSVRENPNFKQRAESARSNPQFQQRAESARSNPQFQQRAQTASSRVAQRPSGGERFGGGGLSGLNRSGASIDRAAARGAASRASAGGFSRGGGGSGFGRRR